LKEENDPNNSPQLNLVGGKASNNSLFNKRKPSNSSKNMPNNTNAKK
jgi:hypothetical protein